MDAVTMGMVEAACSVDSAACCPGCALATAAAVAATAAATTAVVATTAAATAATPARLAIAAILAARKWFAASCLRERFAVACRAADLVGQQREEVRVLAGGQLVQFDQSGLGSRHGAQLTACAGRRQHEPVNLGQCGGV